MKLRQKEIHYVQVEKHHLFQTMTGYGDPQRAYSFTH